MNSLIAANLKELMIPYGVSPVHIHYTVVDGDKRHICGVNKKWSKEECSQNCEWLKLENKEDR